MKRKLIIFVSMFLVLSLVFPVVAQDKSITIWITGGDNEATALTNAAAAFTEETGIKVNVEAVGWSDAQAKYLTAINSAPTNMGMVMAAALLVSLPTLILFLLFQKQFVRGIALTGIRG